MPGWPVAMIAFYGPNLSQATKAAVGIVSSENAEPAEMRDRKVDCGDIRNDAGNEAPAVRNWGHVRSVAGGRGALAERIDTTTGGRGYSPSHKGRAPAPTSFFAPSPQRSGPRQPPHRRHC